MKWAMFPYTSSPPVTVIELSGNRVQGLPADGQPNNTYQVVAGLVNNTAVTSIRIKYSDGTVAQVAPGIGHPGLYSFFSTKAGVSTVQALTNNTVVYQSASNTSAK